MLCNKALDLGDRYHIRPNQKQSETLGEAIKNQSKLREREASTGPPGPPQNKDCAAAAHSRRWKPTELHFLTT